MIETSGRAKSPFFSRFVLSLPLLLWAPAFVQAASVESIANYSADDRQRVLEDGARQEAELDLYSSNVQGDAIALKSFSEKYPYIHIALFRGDGPVLIQKIFEERSASRNSADVVETATGGLRPLLAEGMLQSFRSPELAAYRQEAVEKDRHYAFNYQSFVSLGYNSDLVADAEAPNTLDDLLAANWRDKMAFPGTSTLANWIGAVLQEKDESWLRRLATQRIRSYEVSALALANLIVSGEVAMSPAMVNAHMINAKEQGAHATWRALGGVYANVSGIALSAAAPHPHAAMLYVDFILSREAQVNYQKLGYASARLDLDNAALPAKIYYLTERPNYLEDYEKWTQIGREIFGQATSQAPSK